jgi:hypothetical protein
MAKKGSKTGQKQPLLFTEKLTETIRKLFINRCLHAQSSKNAADKQ